MTLSDISAELLKLSDAAAWQRFTELCDNPAVTQKSVLSSILKKAADSEFGRQYRFGNITNADEYRQRLRLSEWKDYISFSEQMQRGAENLLFPGRPEFFIMTSGTSGNSKLIAESAAGIEAKAATDKLRRGFTFGAHPEIMQGKILPLVNSANLGYTACGIPYGTASGLTLTHAPPTLLRQCAFPLEILKIDNPAALDYLLIRFALAEDVRLVIGNNIARLNKLANLAAKHANQICDEIENGTISDAVTIEPELRSRLTKNLVPNPARARFLRAIIDCEKVFIPKQYWNNMQVVCCWISGSVGNSIPSVRKLFTPETVFLDYGYGASEGKFNIPHIAGEASGPLALHAAFYEFIADDEHSDTATPATLLAHELEKGKNYRLVITNYSGLYRYEMHDLIKVTGFYKNTPEIVFVSKTGDVGNIAGEKLAGATVCAAATAAAQKCGISIRHICAVTVNAPPHYIFCVEPENNCAIPDDFVEKLDQEIRNDIGYGNKRRDNLLKEPELRIMKAGFLERIYREKTSAGLSRAQIKLPVIYAKMPFAEFCE